MSMLEIYQMATLAKDKLLLEAQHKDHDLVRIVHHAQLYDTLLQKYYEAEDRKEAEALKEETRGRKGYSTHVERKLSVIEEDPEDASNSDSDNDSDSDIECEDGASALLAYHDEVEEYSQSYKCATIESITSVSVTEVELGADDE